MGWFENLLAHQLTQLPEIPHPPWKRTNDKLENPPWIEDVFPIWKWWLSQRHSLVFRGTNALIAGFKIRLQHHVFFTTKWMQGLKQHENCESISFWGFLKLVVERGYKRACICMHYQSHSPEHRPFSLFSLGYLKHQKGEARISYWLNSPSGCQGLIQSSQIKMILLMVQKSG